MKLKWLTDIHLNFLSDIERAQFYQTIQPDCDAILITGDIAEADSIGPILKEMANVVMKPIYFVLGNHDYYRGQINEIRSEMNVLTNDHSLLFWLPANEPIILDNDTILVGQDGWADGRYGDYQNSPVMLNDSRMIADLFQKRLLGKDQLLEKMQQLADEDANNLYDNLKLASTHHPRKIIILTHVPPFKETCWHEGKITDDNYMPYFSSKATGDILLHFAKEHESIELLVLCGHTHDACQFKPLENLTVCVGQARYYQPGVQIIIETRV